MVKFLEYIAKICKPVGVHDVHALLNSPVKKLWFHWVNALYHEAHEVLRDHLYVKVDTTGELWEVETRTETMKCLLEETPMTIQQFFRSFKPIIEETVYPEDFEKVYSIVVRNYALKHAPEKFTWKLKDYIQYHFGDVQQLLNIPGKKRWNDWVDMLRKQSKGIFIREKDPNTSTGDLTFIQFLNSFKFDRSDTSYTYLPNDFDVAYKALIQKYLSVVECVQLPPKVSRTLREYIETAASMYRPEEIDKIMKFSGKQSCDDWFTELNANPLLKQYLKGPYKRDDKIGVYSFFSLFRLPSSEDGFDEAFIEMIATYFNDNGLPDNFKQRLYTACTELGLNFNTVSLKMENDNHVRKTEDEWKEEIFTDYTLNGLASRLNIEQFLRSTDDLVTALKHYMTNQPSVKRMRQMKEHEDVETWLKSFRQSQLAMLPREVLDSGLFEITSLRSEKHIREEISLGLRSYCIGMMAKTHTIEEIIQALYTFARSMVPLKYKLLIGFFDRTIGINKDFVAIDYAIKALHYVIMVIEEDFLKFDIKCDGSTVARRVQVDPIVKVRLFELVQEYEAAIVVPVVSAIPLPPTPPPTVVTPPVPPVPPPPTVVTPPVPPTVTPPVPPPPTVVTLPVAVTSPPPSVTPGSPLNPAVQNPNVPIPQHAVVQEYRKRFAYLDEKGFVRTKKLLNMMGFKIDTLDSLSINQAMEKSGQMIKKLKTFLYYDENIKLNFNALAAQYHGFDGYITPEQMNNIIEAYEASDKEQDIEKLYELVNNIFDAQPKIKPKQVPVSKAYTKAMNSQDRVHMLDLLNTIDVNGKSLDIFPIYRAVRMHFESRKAAN